MTDAKMSGGGWELVGLCPSPALAVLNYGGTADFAVLRAPVILRLLDRGRVEQ